MEISGLTINKKDREARLLLTGKLTIQNSEILKESLNDALNEVESLTFDLSEVEECDFTCLQMFFSLSKKAEMLKVNLYLYCPDGSRFDKLTADAGFDNLTGFMHLIKREDVLCQK